MLAKVWYDKDASLDPIRDETIAVIGYGIQGNAQANCLKDSGLNVILGLRKEGKSWDQATKDGHKVYEIPEATKRGDIVLFLLPDMEQDKVYKTQIGPYLTKGKTFGVAHGAAVKFPRLWDLV